MLFQKRFWPGIADGSVTATFRRWQRPQAVAGHRYRTPAGFIDVTDVAVVDPSEVEDRDAARAGYPSAAELLAGLEKWQDRPLYRIDFTYAGADDPRQELADRGELDDDEVAELDRRLDKMDRLSAYGPWTVETLGIIERRPAVRAPDLAAELGRETAPFKRDVRKLKALGLTISLERGYELSARGQAYVARTGRQASSG